MLICWRINQIPPNVLVGRATENGKRQWTDYPLAANSTTRRRAMPGFQMEARVSIEGSEVRQHMGAEYIGVGRGWSTHTQVPGAREGGGVGIPHLRH